jgi:hypothetical protein
MDLDRLSTGSGAFNTDNFPPALLATPAKVPSFCMFIILVIRSSSTADCFRRARFTGFSNLPAYNTMRHVTPTKSPSTLPGTSSCSTLYYTRGVTIPFFVTLPAFPCLFAAFFLPPLAFFFPRFFCMMISIDELHVTMHDD